MNKSSSVLCGLLALLAIEARGGELYAPEQDRSPSISTTARAEVKQATLRALSAGEVSFGDVDLPATVASPAGRTRAEVRQEMLQAKAAHELNFGDVDLPPLATSGAGRSGTEGRGELFAGRKARPQTSDRRLYSN